MKITEILKLYLPWRQTIIQMSPVRSGSTLVWNLLKHTFPNAHIVKHHTCGWFFNYLKIVATVRHPFDCIASIHKANGWEPSLESVERGATRFLQNGAEAIVSLKDRPDVLVLRYEEFVNNFEVIFEAFESFFGVEIDTHKREQLVDQFGIESVKKITQEQGTFKSWDKETLFHGNHISEYNGSSGYGVEFFSEEQIKRIEELCSDYMEAFGYTQ